MDTKDMKVDPENVKRLRLARAMSQEELAGAAGLNVRTVQRIESDGVASLESKKAIASVFGIELTDLDDTRSEQAKHTAGLSRGRKYGLAGVALGGIAAVAAIASGWFGGGLTTKEAGIYSSLLGAGLGITLATIGIVAEHLKGRRATRP